MALFLKKFFFGNRCQLGDPGCNSRQNPLPSSSLSPHPPLFPSSPTVHPESRASHQSRRGECDNRTTWQVSTTRPDTRRRIHRSNTPVTASTGLWSTARAPRPRNRPSKSRHPTIESTTNRSQPELDQIRTATDIPAHFTPDTGHQGRPAGARSRIHADRWQGGGRGGEGRPTNEWMNVVPTTPAPFLSCPPPMPTQQRTRTTQIRLSQNH